MIIFLISVICVLCFQYFRQAYLNFSEKSLFYKFFHLLGIDTDPDRHAGFVSSKILRIPPDPDPVHNTALCIVLPIDNYFL